MAVRKLKPTTPGQRHRIKLSYDTITTSTPEKSLIKKDFPGIRNKGTKKLPSFL